MSTDTVTKRLHVGGLTPDITTSHIRDRFASFGKVQMVEDLANDALGQKRPFTFLNIETTPSQLKKCLNIMSGSMWRGTQLRIAEAKPIYSERLASERESLPEIMERQSKKRKRSERAFNLATGIGKEAQDMRPVTIANHSSKKFWNLTSTGHLIRPIAMRPCHSLPASLQEKTSNVAKPRPAPTRARRRVINPFLWAPTHLGEPSLLSSDPSTAQAGVWVWEDATTEDEVVEDEPMADETILIGRWLRTVDGEVIETQPVRQRQQVEHEILEEESEGEESQQEMDDSGDELFARRDDREGSPLFSTGIEKETLSDVEVEASIERSPSPLFGIRTAPVTETPIASSSRSPSPLFGFRAAKDLQAEVEEATSDSIIDRGDAEAAEEQSAGSQTEDDEVSVGSSAETVPQKPLSLTISAARADAGNTISAKAQVVVPDPLRRQFQSERSRDLSLLDSILATSSSIDLQPRKAIFGGFAESDSEDEEDDQAESKPEGVLRLRGGAPDEDDEDEDENMSSEASDSDSESESSSSSSTSSSSSSDSSDSTSDSDEEEDETDDDGAGDGDEDHGDQAATITASQPETSSRPLKAMFAPTAQSSGGGGFSLLASLDPDLELDELDVPLAPSVRPAGENELAPLELLHPTSTVSGLFDPDPSIPLFFPTASTFTDNSDSGKKGKDGYADTMQGREWRGFWRAEGESDEMMKEIWNRDRGELTKEWKKRHREAKKHRRRRGGVEEDQP